MDYGDSIESVRTISLFLDLFLLSIRSGGTNGYSLKRTATRARIPKSDTNAATTPASDNDGAAGYDLLRSVLYNRYSMVAATSENNPMEIINTANWRGPMTL